jgi:hypothetical protein
MEPRLTEVVMKATNGQIIMRCFARHISFNELIRNIQMNFENRTGEKARNMYIPLPDPVEGSDRTLSSEDGYNIWIKYGQTRIIDVYLTENSAANLRPKNPETGKRLPGSEIYTFAFSKLLSIVPTCSSSTGVLRGID